MTKNQDQKNTGNQSFDMRRPSLLDVFDELKPSLRDFKFESVNPSPISVNSIVGRRKSPPRDNFELHQPNFY